MPGVFAAAIGSVPARQHLSCLWFVMLTTALEGVSVELFTSVAGVEQTGLSTPVRGDRAGDTCCALSGRARPTRQPAVMS